MRKHITRLLTTLLALVMLLPIVAQAAPTDGWTADAEHTISARPASNSSFFIVILGFVIF